MFRGSQRRSKDTLMRHRRLSRIHRPRRLRGVPQRLIGAARRAPHLLATLLPIVLGTCLVGLPLAGADVGDAPDVTTPVISDIKTRTAALEGEVNANGLETTYRFEYRVNGAPDWTPLPEGDEGIGDGTDPQSVSQQAEGLEPNTLYEVRLVATNSTGTSTSPVETFTTLPPDPPSVTVPTVTDVTNDGAVFSGEVNPNGSDTGYHFEYRPLGGLGWTSVPDGGDNGVGDGTEPQSVSEQAVELESDTEYEVRLVASNEFGTTASTEELFTTGTAPAPFVTSPVIRSVGPDSATFLGEVNPNGEATSYRFEYRLLGEPTWTHVPAVDEPVGDGTGTLEVSQQVTGLQAASEYEVRLVAVSLGGSPTSDPRAFKTLADVPPPAPASRAFERVSPADKNGEGILPSAGPSAPAASAQSGDGTIFFGLASFAGNPAAPFPSPYRAQRGTSEWSVQGISPPLQPLGDLTLGRGTLVMASSDVSRVVVRTTSELIPGIPPSMDDMTKLYVRDLSTSVYQLLTLPPVAGPPTYDVQIVDADSHMDRVLFETDAELTAVAVGVGGIKLYQWRNGTVTLMSVLPDSTPAAGTGGHGTSGDKVVDNAISDDGSVSFFTSPPTNQGSLYRREAGVTTPVNTEENDLGSNPLGSAVFRGATPDGRKVFFTSPQQLAEEDTNAAPDLYMYTHSANPDVDDNLTLVSVDEETAPDSGDDTGTNAAVEGVLGFSEDGARVYFVARGQLVDGGPTLDQNYLYVGDSGTIRYIGGLPLGENQLWLPDNGGFARLRRTVSANGAKLLLISASDSLTPDDNQGVEQAYLYDALTDQIVCASCPTGGGSPQAAALFRLPNLASDALLNQPRGNLSADGSRAFFATAIPLVAKDTNGQVDVYMYENGRPHLVSTGRSSTPSLFASASRAGDDVFFTTTERLVGWDTDSLRDLYDARVGGGLPEPVPTRSCEGDECQGPLAGGPSLESPGSVRFQGGGNAKGRSRTSLRVPRLTRSQRRRLARRGSVALKIRVPSAGRLSLSATTRVGKRNRVAARASRRVQRAGVVTVRLDLARFARRELTRGRRLAVRLTVRFSPGRIARTVRFTLIGVARGPGR